MKSLMLIYLRLVPCTFNQDQHMVATDWSSQKDSHPIQGHTDYPFALHDLLLLSWDYLVHNGVMIIHAQSCDGHGSKTGDSQSCWPCQDLWNNMHLKGIYTMMEGGVHENTRFAYHSFNGQDPGPQNEKAGFCSTLGAEPGMKAPCESWRAFWIQTVCTGNIKWGCEMSRLGYHTRLKAEKRDMGNNVFFRSGCTRDLPSKKLHWRGGKACSPYMETGRKPFDPYQSSFLRWSKSHIPAENILHATHNPFSYTTNYPQGFHQCQCHICKHLGHYPKLDPCSSCSGHIW